MVLDLSRPTPSCIGVWVGGASGAVFIFLPVTSLFRNFLDKMIEGRRPCLGRRSLARAEDPV